MSIGPSEPPTIQPYVDMGGRNICFLGPFAPDISGDGYHYQMAAYFYASKVIIRIEKEAVRSEKKLITGEIRVRWKNRRTIELEIPFFDTFNQFIDEARPGYREFEIIINSPELQLQYFGWTDGLDSGTRTFDTYPYREPDIGITEAIPVIFRESPKIEYLDDLIDKKIVRLTFYEKYSRY